MKIIQILKRSLKNKWKKVLSNKVLHRMTVSAYMLLFVFSGVTFVQKVNSFNKYRSLGKKLISRNAMLFSFDISKECLIISVYASFKNHEICQVLLCKF